MYRIVIVFVLCFEGAEKGTKSMWFFVGNKRSISFPSVAYSIPSTCWSQLCELGLVLSWEPSCCMEYLIMDGENLAAFLNNMAQRCSLVYYRWYSLSQNDRNINHMWLSLMLCEKFCVLLAGIATCIQVNLLDLNVLGGHLEGPFSCSEISHWTWR